MKMKTCLTLLITLYTFNSGLSYAQTEAGHGGLAIVCRSPEGKITSAKLLDLVEAQERDGLNIPEAKGTDWKAVLADAEVRLTDDARISRLLRGSTQYWIENKIKYNMVSGFELPDPKDFNPRIFPRSPCKFEVAALFDDSSSRLNIVQDIFDAMSTTHKAALFMHEARYRHARWVSTLSAASFVVNNSNAVRLLIGAVFSDQSVKLYDSALLVEPIAGAPFKVCTYTYTSSTGSGSTKSIILTPEEKVIDVGDFKINLSSIYQMRTFFTLSRKNATSNYVSGTIYSGADEYGNPGSSVRFSLDGSIIEIYCSINSSVEGHP